MQIERVSHRKTLFSCLFVKDLHNDTADNFSLSNRVFLHFIPVKLHFVKKTFRLIENLLWYKYSGRHGQHRRVTASIPAGELQGRSFRNMKNNSS